MGLTKAKQLARELNKPELFVFYTPQPTHIIRMAYLVKNGKRFMKMPTHRFEAHCNQERNTNVSIQSSRKIKYAVNWLVASAQTKRLYVRVTNKSIFFKVAFLTLTFPASDYFRKLEEIRKKVPCLYTRNGIQFVRSAEERYVLASKELDRLTKECLANFLSRARVKFGMNHYVWKAETTAEGVMHYHVSWDCFAHYDSIRKTWNKILHHHGFTRDFFEVHGNNNPPSTHIKAVAKVKNIAAYVCTYMSKKEQDRRVVHGRVWGCSEELQYSKRLVIDVPSQVSSHYDKTLDSSNFVHKSIDTIATNLTSSIHLADLYIFKNSSIFQLPSGELKSDIMDFVAKLRSSPQQLFYEVDSFTVKSEAVQAIISHRPLPSPHKIVQLSTFESN